MRERPDPERRRFIGGLLTGLASAGVLSPAAVQAAEPIAEGHTAGTYRRTPHVDSYYRSLQD